MTDRGEAWLVDLTRLASRIGHGPMTGVDRVEYAYLRELTARPVVLFGLVRTALGFVLLDRAGIGRLAALVEGRETAPRAGLLGRLLRRGQPRRADAEALLRRVAVARVPVPLLPWMLRRHLPEGFRYLNLGHANLTPRVFSAVHAVPGARAGVLLHDVIPLDHPELTRVGIPEVFARKMAAVAIGADMVIHTTLAGRARDEAQLVRFGRVPRGRVAHLGMVPPVPEPRAVPADLDLSAPYCVVLGTIEPRKNHALLLDIWDRLPEAPRLIILGGRGWRNEAVFRRLDALAADGRIVERAGLSDGAVAAILAGARALLFPTFAEGTGLPALEAAALGVTVICSDLPELRELMGDYPVYLAPTDGYAWSEVIGSIEQAGGSSRDRGARFVLPSWEDHFKTTLSPDW